MCIKNTKTKKKTKEIKKKSKSKTCVLTPYEDSLSCLHVGRHKRWSALTPDQDVLVFSALKDIKRHKMTRFNDFSNKCWLSAKLLNMGNLVLKKSSYSLKNKFSPLLSNSFCSLVPFLSLFFNSFCFLNTQLKQQQFCLRFLNIYILLPLKFRNIKTSWREEMKHNLK